MDKEDSEEGKEKSFEFAFALLVVELVEKSNLRHQSSIDRAQLDDESSLERI